MQHTSLANTTQVSPLRDQLLAVFHLLRSQSISCMILYLSHPIPI